MNNRLLLRVLLLTFLLAVWEVSGSALEAVAIPSPSAIGLVLVRESGIFFAHATSTLVGASIGLLSGVLIAISMASAAHLARSARGVFLGPPLALFALPVPALAPLLAVLLPQNFVPSTLAALTVIYPVTAIVGRALDRPSVEHQRIFETYAVNRVQKFLRLDAPSAIPGLVGSLQVAVPWSILGAMLGEFVGGRWGLGVLLLGSLGRGEPSRLWAIATIATALSLLGYAAIGALRKWAQQRFGFREVITEEQELTSISVSSRDALLAVMTTLVAWAIIAAASGVPAPVVLGPAEVIGRILDRPGVLAPIGLALAETIVPAMLALILSAGLAIAWFLVTRFYELAGQVITSVLFLTQAVPLVAIAPLLLLTFGRDQTGTITIAILAVIFPIFEAIRDRAASAPTQMREVSRAFGGSEWRHVVHVESRWLVYGVFTGLRVAAPRAMLGVVLAQTISTGTGVGLLIFRARGTFDFPLIWITMTCIATVGAAMFFLFDSMERVVAKSLGVAGR